MMAYINKLPEIMGFLMNEQEPIEKRLKEYDKHRCLAFVNSPEWLHRSFATLFKGNKEYQEAFEAAKIQSIKTIRSKRTTLGYEDFLRYLFFDLGRIEDHWGKQTVQTHENTNQNQPFVYNIVPVSHEEAGILEKVCIDHIKSTDGKGLAANGAFRLGEKSKTLIIGYNSFELLKDKLIDNLNQQFADKSEVIAHFREKYIEPLKVKSITNRPQRIYRNLKSGVIDGYGHSNYYRYYTTKAAVKELIKFEDYLNQIIDKTTVPQELETNKPDEVTKELHNHIFKGNAFEVWQYMYDNFQIIESNRTHVKFMFEEMKKDGLIFNTVSQTTFLDWISEAYQITIQKTSNYSKTKERISIYSNAKQLYKS